MGLREDIELVVSHTGQTIYAEAGWEHHATVLARKLRGEPPLPSLAEQARHAARAAGRASVAALTRRPLRVPEPVRAARLAACRACDRYRPSDDRCGGAGGCGCFVPIKAHLATEKCPLARWPAADP